MLNAATLDTLHREALTLADHARGWFDGSGRSRRNSLPPEAQAAIATESLRVTARLVAVMAWLVDGGTAAAPASLAEAEPPIPAALAGTPGEAIARASRSLAARVAASGAQA